MGLHRSYIQKFNKKILSAICLASAIVASMSFALWNGYPLIYPDMGSYIISGQMLHVPVDRSFGYGIFMLLTGIRFSLWTVIITQATLAVWLIFDFLKYYGFCHSYAITLGITLILLIPTGYSYDISQGMPDTFAPLAFISLWLWFAFDQAPLWTRLRWISLFTLSISVHHSHLLTSVFMILFLTLIFYSKIKQGLKLLTAIPFIAVLLVYLSLSSINAIKNMGFRLNPSASLFLAAKLSEQGLVKKYLYLTCTEKNWKLCPEKDNISENTSDFLWDAQNSPIYKVYFSNNVDDRSTKTIFSIAANELDQIVWDMMLQSEFRNPFIKGFFQSTWKQLFTTQQGWDFYTYDENIPPVYNIRELLPHEYPQLMQSRQQTGAENFYWTRPYQLVFLSLILISIFSVYYVRRNKNLLLFVSAILFFWIINAGITGGLANVYARLQSRVIWVSVLIPFVGLAPNQNKILQIHDI